MPSSIRRYGQTNTAQLALMSVEPGDEIGEEVHSVDQALIFIAGFGEAVLNREGSQVKAPVWS
jgi:hypothetical protein